FSALSMLIVSFRNLAWNGIDGQSRADRMLKLGISKSMSKSGSFIFSLGVMVVYLSSELRFTSFWLVFGMALLFLSSVAILVSVFGNLQDRGENKPVNSEVLLKRAGQRRIFGVVVMIVFMIWIYSGLGSVI
ncbi:hypothetical protein ACFL17_09480, partial [Pseudomonadota bacterium]